MSKIWYPVIDYEKCIECGACVDRCRNGVYDLKKVPTPVVVEADNCIEGCCGCANLCPAEAISYVGDTGKKKDGGGSCGCSCGEGSGGCC